MMASKSITMGGLQKDHLLWKMELFIPANGSLVWETARGLNYGLMALGMKESGKTTKQTEKVN